MQIRLAQKGESRRLKEIWKLSFGDEERYIDLFYAKRYKEEETMVLLEDKEIAAMLTIIPVELAGSDGRGCRAAMLYAVATHPSYRRKGLANKLLDFTDEYLEKNKTELSLLVPAERGLFDFYRRQGYREGFYIREAVVNAGRIAESSAALDTRCRISAVSPGEYNALRNEWLKNKLYIKYQLQDINYQKELCLLAGGDLYTLDLNGAKGCMVAERTPSGKALLKEILAPKEHLWTVLKQAALHLQAEELIIRMPAFTGKNLGGVIRPFAMYKKTGSIPLRTGSRDSAPELEPRDMAYLGLAFD